MELVIGALMANYCRDPAHPTLDEMRKVYAEIKAMRVYETTAKAIYCPRRQQHAAVCETPNECAGGADCRLGPDLNARMNDRPSVSNTTVE